MTLLAPWTRPDWYDDAACAGMDTALWYPDKTGQVPHTARDVCRECPVVDECRDHAVNTGEAGVWGNTSERQRRSIRSRRIRAPRSDVVRVPSDPYKSHSGAIGCHQRWHVQRGIVEPGCPLCRREGVA